METQTTFIIGLHYFPSTLLWSFSFFMLQDVFFIKLCLRDFFYSQILIVCIFSSGQGVSQNDKKWLYVGLVICWLIINHHYIKVFSIIFRKKVIFLFWAINFLSMPSRYDIVWIGCRRVYLILLLFCYFCWDLLTCFVGLFRIRVLKYAPVMI